MKIYTLVENITSNKNLASAHGLSFYIETENHKILFDMGPGDLFWKNAAKLGVDLKEVDIAIISHGHDDHGGGLKTFLERNDTAKVYVNKSAFGEYYSISYGKDEYIGLDKNLSDNSRIVYTDGVTRIDQDLILFSDITGTELCPSSNVTLLEKSAHGMTKDKFNHEQSLIIQNREKNILFGGCAHRGIINILSRAAEIIGNEPDYVISGFHLMMPGGNKVENPEIMADLSNRLKNFSTKYYTCHCTGLDSYKFLKQNLNNQIDYISTGEFLTI